MYPLNANAAKLVQVEPGKIVDLYYSMVEHVELSQPPEAGNKTK